MQYFLFLSLLLLSTNVLAQVDLKQKFCPSVQNKTQQITLDVATISGPRTLQTIILRSQSFISNGQTVSLQYFQVGNNLRIEETKQDLTKIVHTQNIDNKLIYVGSRNSHIVAKKINSQQFGRFDYVLLTANIGVGGNMRRFTISSLVDSQNKDISSLSMTKVIDQDPGYIYVIMNGLQSTHLYRISKHFEHNLYFVADLTTNSALKIAEGNPNHLYDQISNKIYSLKIDNTGSYYFESKSFQELGINSIFAPFPLGASHLDGLVIAYSYVNGSTNILPFDCYSGINASNAININKFPTIQTDNYRNFLAISTNDLVWIRGNCTDYSIFQLSTSSYDQLQRSEISKVFRNSLQVTFSQQKAIILHQQPGSPMGSIVSVAYDSEGTQKLTIVDQYYEAIDLQIHQPDEVLRATQSVDFGSIYGCSCVNTEIKRIECYVAAMKCISVTGPSRGSCGNGQEMIRI